MPSEQSTANFNEPKSGAWERTPSIYIFVEDEGTQPADVPAKPPAIADARTPPCKITRKTRQRSAKTPLDLGKTALVSDGQGAAPGNLQTIVRRRIVRSRDHHRSVETVFRSEEIDHRRGGKPHIHNLRAAGLETGYKRRRDLRRGAAAIPTYEKTLCTDNIRQLAANAIHRSEIEIDSERTSHIICLEESHNRTILLSSAIVYHTIPVPVNQTRRGRTTHIIIISTARQNTKQWSAASHRQFILHGRA